MDLATWWMYGTIFVFMLGAGVVLAWSVAAGHWSALDEAARVVLEVDDSEVSD